MTENNYFFVIGFPKCGQVSMQTYLQNRYSGQPSRNEIAWRDDIIQCWTRIVANHTKSKLTPLFIIRDPIERVWSAFLYMGLPNITHFPTYLINRLYQQYGEGNPIIQSNYSKWINRFKEFNPMVVHIDEIRKNPNFFNVNRTKDVKYKNEEMPSFPDNYRKLTKELLQLEYMDNFLEGDHITGVPTKDARELLRPFNPGEIRRSDYRERA